MTRLLKAESLIALGLMALSLYFMGHATVLPIGWVDGAGPGGGAFPFWLSAVMLLAAGAILLRSLRSDGGADDFFDFETRRAVFTVSGALIVTIALMPVIGTYLALALFMIFFLKIFGGHGWGLTLILTAATPVFLFFFFEVTLKILLPKGITEPLFIPLYAMFF